LQLYVYTTIMGEYEGKFTCVLTFT
jgi:hypothetical protein